jgi:hypothetical protein
MLAKIRSETTERTRLDILTPPQKEIFSRMERVDKEDYETTLKSSKYFRKAPPSITNTYIHS